MLARYTKGPIPIVISLTWIFGYMKSIPVSPHIIMINIAILHHLLLMHHIISYHVAFRMHYCTYIPRVAIVLVSLSIYLHSSYPVKSASEKLKAPAMTSTSHVDLRFFFKDGHDQKETDKDKEKEKKKQ